MPNMSRKARPASLQDVEKFDAPLRPKKAYLRRYSDSQHARPNMEYGRPTDVLVSAGGDEQVGQRSEISMEYAPLTSAQSYHHEALGSDSEGANTLAAGGDHDPIASPYTFTSRSSSEHSPTKLAFSDWRSNETESILKDANARGDENFQEAEAKPGAHGEGEESGGGKRSMLNPPYVPICEASLGLLSR
ncbi:hypothetical protein KEM55_001594 [Ascosphaera atra]|nr:hypothetical protein KEM55_001594 [Ascosphaera atra]